MGEYAPGAKDFSDLILKAKAAQAEAVYALPTPPDGMAIVKQMRELDFNPKLAMLIRAPDPPVWAKNLGKDGDYVDAGARLAPRGEVPRACAELNAAHQKKIGRPADPITGPAYACVQILAAALARAGAPDRDKVRDAIAATDMDGGHRPGEVPAGRHRHRPVGVHPVAQRQAGAGLAEGVRHGAARRTRRRRSPSAERWPDCRSLTLEGLAKAFAGVRAVRDVGFEVPAGAVVGVMGPNGSGKTTLFNLISGR